jgi:hypothetical protein
MQIAQKYKLLMDCFGKVTSGCGLRKINPRLLPDSIDDKYSILSQKALKPTALFAKTLDFSA